VVDAIVDDVVSGRLDIGRAGFAAVQPSLRNVVTFADWQRIEAFEQREAPPGRCRRKITDRKHMLSVAAAVPDAGAALRVTEIAPDTRMQQQLDRKSDQ
jgi:ferredoxin--NADP+ reductase